MGNLARKMARRQAKQLSSSVFGQSAEVAKLPFGPCFMTETWREVNQSQPDLISTMVTRRLPGKLFLAGMALVDRTCLGVKNGYKTKPLNEKGIIGYLEQLSRTGEVEEVEPLEALSVVHHALAYAAKLGFSPQPDFPAQIFGPRPESLIDTPHANDPRPQYLSGPDDDVETVIRTLDETVGKGNYDFVLGGFGDFDL